MPKCSHCGHIAAWDSNACPNCGKQNPAGCAKAIVAAVIIIFLIMVCMSMGKQKGGRGSLSRPDSRSPSPTILI
jgi:hypothetical protein